MPQPRTWILTDVATGTFLERLEVKPGELAGPAGKVSITKQTLRGGLCDGVDLVRVDNGVCSFDILPTRGMNVWKARLGELSIGWKSPVRGPVHPKFVDLGEPSGIGFLDGFDELIARCGLESNGAPEFDERGILKYPVHGRISNRPAHYVSVSVDEQTGEVTVTGVVEESRFHLHKLRMTTVYKTLPGEPGFRWTDTVENYSAKPAEMQILYHINIGAPLLGEGAQMIVPAKRIVPRTAHAAASIDSWSSFPPPVAGTEESVYFFDPAVDAAGHSLAMLRNARGDASATVGYSTKQLPYFAFWRNPVAEADGFVCGIEPTTNFPNPRSFEGRHGRVVKLAPGGKQSFDLSLKFANTAAAVEADAQAVRKLQEGITPEIHRQPWPEWCA